MAKIDLETVTEPISEEQPCGPDLDMEFDMDFMNFAAEIDGVIPTRYFDWDPASLDFEKYYEQIAGFLQRTRDIRLLVPLAKLRILQSDLPGFAEVLDAIHRLLAERWNEVHPQPGEFLELSMGQLSTLDDMPNVVLPLQHAVILRSRRAGAITLRKWQVAHGEVNPREGEDTVDASTLSAALAEADPDELARPLEALERARDAIAGIRTISTREAGFEKAPQFERLPPAIEAAIAMIRSPSGGDAAAGAGEAGTAADDGSGTVVVRLPAGAVANREEAVEAMHAAARYFALHEPSSPVPILLREAQAASSKSFYELVSALMPDHATSAFVSLGREPWFEVYLSTLDERNPAPDYAEEQEPIAAEDAGLGDDEEGDDEAGAAAGEATDSDSEAGEAAGDEPEEADESWGSTGAADENGAAGDDSAEPAEPASEPEILSPERSGRFSAGSRPEAVALLEKVVAYYRFAEPTSPVPLLVERAIDMSSKSFIELLGKVLPEGTLKVRAEE